MQTVLFVQKARQLNQEIENLIAEDRASPVSQDILKHTQNDLDRLMREKHNPTLSCLLDLRENANRLGLNTGCFDNDLQDSDAAWSEHYQAG